MNIHNFNRHSNQAFALAWTIMFLAVSMLVLGAAMAWTTSAARLTDRNNQYNVSMAAAEAATEKVVGAIMNDFRNGNQGRVFQNMGNYPALVPTVAEDALWSNFTFTDPNGVANKVYVANIYTNVFTNVDSQYTGLKGYASKYRVVANAINNNGMDQVAAGVAQEVQVATIPIFQYAIFYHNMPLEISCGQPFNIYGRVHANQQMYVLPDSALTFYDNVTSVGDITLSRAPGDGRTPPTGTVDYRGGKESRVASLNLPIGTNNSPEAVHALLETPLAGEDPASIMGRQRFYNKAEMLITVTSTNVTVTSGRLNNFATLVSSNQFKSFITLTNSFTDAREGKIVRPIDLDIGRLKKWSETNSSIRSLIGGDVSLVYVDDKRTLTTDLGAVRVTNGRDLPSRGLTVATARPLYVQGHYNCTNNTALGTTNTLTTKPAALIADAITVLSPNWTDANSTAAVGSRNALPTTVNAAFLAGIVETKTFASYSGGVENFPRFLETWGAANIFTYNGSMVVMFPSRYATNRWGQSNIYGPPARNWAFDQNFKDATKLPPGTPSVNKLFRSKWAAVVPGPGGLVNN